MNKELYKKAGYSHIVEWKEAHPDYGVLTKSFPTTPDAVEIHRATLIAKQQAIVSFEIKEI